MNNLHDRTTTNMPFSAPPAPNMGPVFVCCNALVLPRVSADARQFSGCRGLLQICRTQDASAVLNQVFQGSIQAIKSKDQSG